MGGYFQAKFQINSMSKRFLVFNPVFKQTRLKKMQVKKSNWIVAFTVAFTLALLLTGCDKKLTDKPSASDTATSSSDSAPASVATAHHADNEIELLASEVMTAKAERYQPNIAVAGTLQTAERTEVQATISAQVVAVFADVGQRVKQGERLIALDNRSSKDQLVQAQADVAAATAQARVASSLAQKNKVLLEQGFVSQIEYERSVADATAQQEALKARQAQLNAVKRLGSDTVITAPSSGVIGTRNVEVGQVVNPNQPLMSIVAPDKLEFAANVPSEAQGQLSVGQHVPFTVANNATVYGGQISRIAPQIDPNTRQLTVYIAVKPSEISQHGQTLKAGMYAKGQVDYGQIQVGVLIPMSALTLAPSSANQSTADKASPAQLSAQATGNVWVIGKDKILTRQSVHIIRRDDANSQYLVDGIEQGTMVVLANLSETDVGKKVVLK